MSNTPIVPKRERSPTPPLTLTPRTSGVKLVAPLPAACKRSSPNYIQARRQWLKGEIKALNTLGLTVTKHFIRDDGLSLEWESPVPVWPDTLKPANPPSASTSSPVHVEEDDGDMQREQEVSQLDQEAEAELDRQASELEDLAIEFLKKFVQTFDTNRAALSDAYAPNALFSYSIHECTSIPRNSVAAAFTNPTAAAQRFAPRKGARNLRPSEIVSALQSLGPHKFCARSPTELRWNVLALQIDQSQGQGQPSKSKSTKSRPLVFLSSHGDLIEERAGSEKRLSFDQCFLLQRSQGSVSGTESETDTVRTKEAETEWPLVAVDHQLTVRDLSLRPLAF